MNINVDCIRDVLITCADNIDVEKTHGNKWDIKYETLQNLYQSELKNKYEEKEIMYTVSKLYECGFIIIQNRLPAKSVYIESCWIVDITFRGHQFLSSIKEPTTWEKVKKVLSSAGNYTLDFITDTAKQIAVAATTALIAKL